MKEIKDVSILLVDDEVELKKAMIFDLKRKGFNVLDASNGKEAFEIVKNNQVDVVLTDVRMPRGDGVELLDKLKDFNAEIPVVMFITGFSDLPVEEAYHKGADAIFCKPFDRKLLLATILKVITPKDERWSAERSDFPETDFRVEHEFSELKLVSHKGIMNIGRGGMFVALETQFPSVGDEINFCIKFDQGLPQGVEGVGIVRWIRTQVSKNCVKGYGIEFESLSEKFRQQVIDYMSALRTKAFIPRK